MFYCKVLFRVSPPEQYKRGRCTMDLAQFSASLALPSLVPPFCCKALSKKECPLARQENSNEEAQSLQMDFKNLEFTAKSYFESICFDMSCTEKQNGDPNMTMHMVADCY